MIFFFFFPSILLFSYVDGESLKLRINQRGSDYISGIAKEMLDKEIRGIQIPYYSGKQGKINVEAKNGRIDEFALPQTKLDFLEGGMLLNTSGGSFKGSVRVCGSKRIIFKMSQCANAYFDGDGINSRILLKIKPGTEKPQLEIASCSMDISGFNVNLRGNILVKIANMFRGKIANSFKAAIAKEACPLFIKMLGEKLNPQIADLPNVIPLGGKNNYAVEYNNFKANIGPNFLEVSADTSFHYIGKTCQATTLEPFDAGNPSTMLTVWTSSAIPNCILTILHETSQLQYTISEKLDFASSFLKTSCSGNGFIPECFGELFPQLARDFPNRSVEVIAYTLLPPQISFSPNGIRLSAITNLNVTLESKNLAQFNLNVSSSILPRLQGNRLFGNVTVEKTELKLLTSSIGTVDQLLIDAAQQPMAFFATQTLQPRAEQGFEFKNFIGSRLAESSGIAVLKEILRLDLDLAKA